MTDARHGAGPAAAETAARAAVLVATVARGGTGWPGAAGVAAQATALADRLNALAEEDATVFGAALAAAHLVRANLVVSTDDDRVRRAFRAADDARYSASRALDAGP